MQALAVKGSEFGKLRAVTINGPRVSERAIQRQMKKQFAEKGDARKATQNYLDARRAVFQEAKKLLGEARPIKRLVGEAINLIGKEEKGENRKLMSAFFRQLHETQLGEAAQKYWDAGNKLEAHDLDAAARVYKATGLAAARLGDHGYAAGFFATAAYCKVRSANALSKEPWKFGPKGTSEKRAQKKMNEALALFEKAAKSRKEQYFEETYKPYQMKDDGDHWETLRAIAKNAVQLYKDALEIAYNSKEAREAKPSCGRNQCEARSHTANHFPGIREMNHYAFEVTTCFPGLRGEVLDLHSFPWRGFRQ